MKIIFVYFIIFISYIYASDTNLEKISLQLNWKYQFEHAGFIAAKEKGFYKEVGLDVDLIEYNMQDNIEAKVINGKATYGVYNSSLIIDYLKGKPIKLIASFFKRSALVLVTQPYIKSPKDLKGKTVMGSSYEDLELNFMPYFNAYDLKLSDIILVPHTYSLEKFIDKKVDAMTAFKSDQLYKLDRLGVLYNVLDPSDENLYVLQEELFTSLDEVNNHPVRVSNFRYASIKGWQYALSHKEELVEIIKNKYSLDSNKDDLMAEAKAIEKSILPFTYDIGSIDKNFLNKQMNYLKRHYKIVTQRGLDGFIFYDKLSTKSNNFTKDEKEYIRENKNIKVCINYDLFPLDGYKNGKMIGEISELYDIISSKTLLNFIPVKSNSEEDLINKINEKECKMLSITAQENRDKFKTLKTTSSISSTHFTLISKLDKSFIYDDKDLEGKTLVVQKQSFKDYLLSFYPYLTIKVEKSKYNMVKDLLNNKVYAIATLDEQADYIIDRYGYGKLKINGFLAREHQLHAALGVQKDELLLFSIIQKTLNQIPQQKIQSIEDSWRISRYQTNIDYSLVFKVIFIMGLIFIIMYYYQRKLKNFNKELEILVNEKTKELREVNESLEAKVKEKIEELIKKDEILTMQSKQAVMGEMLSMIAHQWRQPLNTITLQISNLQIREMMGVDTDKKELMKMFDDISKTIVYLSDTIDDFKTYFDPNKSAIRLKLSEIIDRALKFIRPRLKSKKIEIEIIYKEDIEISIFINEFIQVLLNIINNAIDAYDEVDLDKKVIKIDISEHDKNIVFVISDNAGGIKDETIKNIFDPYFSTKGKNGTGLGLYMSKMIIEKQFSGKIDVESIDKSTTFTIEIPKDLGYE